MSNTSTKISILILDVLDTKASSTFLKESKFENKAKIIKNYLVAIVVNQHVL